VLLVRAGWVGIDPVSTRAIRSGSAEVPSNELHRPLVDGESAWVRDWRDLLLAPAPLHDCARRLGSIRPASSTKQQPKGPRQSNSTSNASVPAQTSRPLPSAFALTKTSYRFAWPA
jgi:hypothetical protein